MNPLSAWRPGRRNWKSALGARALAWFVPLVFAGTAVGFLVTRAPGEYVSDTELVVAEGNRPLAPGSVSAGTTAALAELAHSRVVARNVIDALKLHKRPGELLGQIRVATPRPGILRISVRDPNRRRARQIAAQVDLVYSALVQADFGSRTPVPLRTTVWDAAGEARPVAGHELLGSLLGALAGALLAFGGSRVLGARGRRAPADGTPADPRELKIAERERKLEARESELKEKAAQLADAKRQALREQAADLDRVEQARTKLVRGERELERQQRELDARERNLAALAAERDAREAERVEAVDGGESALPDEVEAIRELTQPAPAPAPDPPVEPPPALVLGDGVAASEWNLGELERLVEDNALNHPGRVEEWRYYILYLRNFAGPGGSLPHSFDALVEEAFGELLQAV